MPFPRPSPGPSRSRAVVALACAVTATIALALVVAGTAGAAPRAERALTVTVTGTGDPALDRTHELRCDPAGGDHPDATAACARLDELARSGWDEAFAPVPDDAMCTKIYGGPQTARVVGTWDGRTVDATFNRSGGCEIARWKALQPLLPGTGS